jgi:peptidoglycan hydrolase-like protein with peptidoglycan-binding domain
MRWLSIVACTALASASFSSSAPAWARAGQASASSAAQNSSITPSHKKSKKHHSRSAPKQKEPTPERTSEIQSALSRGGYYQGDPNGKWDSNTVAAVQKFQSANGIEANGKLDAPTLQRLGLGSDIAGVSAPKPVSSPSGKPALGSPVSSIAPSANSSIVPASDAKPPQK